MKTERGRVIKAVASKFFVDTGSCVRVCFARKKLKSEGNILVGDRVRLLKERDSYVIESVEPRRNSLIRPYVSNVDVCFIVAAYEPEPDFLLIDKVIINCLEQLIKPVLVINKTDIETVDHSEYNNVCEIFCCSADTGEGVAELIASVRGKTVCFAGQSAVGKSSIINKILDGDILPIGELAKKVKRGKHTTRQTEIIPLGDGTYFADTCGFSMLDAVDVPPEELRLYYDDMELFRRDCKFASCTHTDEPDCAVRPHVGAEVGKGRYERYKFILNELYERRKEKYD